MSKVYLNKVPIGIPMFNSSIYILDAGNKVVDEGELGEMAVYGDNVTPGYVRDKAREKFIQITGERIKKTCL